VRLPPAIGGPEFSIWRLDEKQFASDWDKGEGAYRFGGRWHSRGLRAVYCTTDPATAILEVAVHKGFQVLDTVPHVLTEIEITEPAGIHIVRPEHVPNPNWLRPGVPSAGQQTFGDKLLDQHKFILIPSVVSPRSWNVIFVADRAVGAYKQVSQEALSLDTRLNPVREPKT
jgi:RES domain-containing protein